MPPGFLSPFLRSCPVLVFLAVSFFGPFAASARPAPASAVLRPPSPDLPFRFPRARAAPVVLPSGGSGPAPHACRLFDPASSLYLRCLVAGEAARRGLPAELVCALVDVESAWNPGAVSSAGALGLMQILPSTAAGYGVRTVSALLDPVVNVVVGVRHLADLSSAFPILLALAAWHGGPPAAADPASLRSGRRPRTAAFVRAVSARYAGRLRALTAFPAAARARIVLC